MSGAPAREEPFGAAEPEPPGRSGVRCPELIVDRSGVEEPVAGLVEPDVVVAVEGARTLAAGVVAVVDGVLTFAEGAVTVADGVRTGAAVTVGALGTVGVFGACTVVAGTSTFTGGGWTGTDGASTDTAGVVTEGVEIDGGVGSCPKAGGDHSATVAVAVVTAETTRPLDMAPDLHD